MLHFLRENNKITSQDSPSMAYFISWANKFHMTSALIFPTFSSCGNLWGYEDV